GIERLRVDDIEGELEALEEPAHPTTRARPAVAIPQADANRPQLERPALRRCRDAREREPKIPRGFLKQRRCSRTARDIHRTESIGRAATAAIARRLHGFARFQQPIDGDEGVVLMMADQITRRLLDTGDASCRMRDRRDALE